MNVHALRYKNMYRNACIQFCWGWTALWLYYLGDRLFRNHLPVAFSVIILGMIKRKPQQNCIQAFLCIFLYLEAWTFIWEKVYQNSPPGSCCKLPQNSGFLLQIAITQKYMHMRSIWHWVMLDGCICYFYTKFHDLAVKIRSAATCCKIECRRKF